MLLGIALDIFLWIALIEAHESFAAYVQGKILNRLRYIPFRGNNALDGPVGHQTLMLMYKIIDTYNPDNYFIQLHNQLCMALFAFLNRLISNALQLILFIAKMNCVYSRRAFNALRILLISSLESEIWIALLTSGINFLCSSPVWK